MLTVVLAVNDYEEWKVHSFLLSTSQVLRGNRKKSLSFRSGKQGDPITMEETTMMLRRHS